MIGDTFRVERYDPAWGGFRNDDLTVGGLGVTPAKKRARTQSQGTTQPVRVVNEATGVVVATYRRGRADR